MNELKCILFGECVHRDYEFTFYFNNEAYKTDSCFINLFGYSSCEYQNKIYENVSFESKVINEFRFKKKGFIEILFPFLFIFILFLILRFVFGKILMKGDF